MGNRANRVFYFWGDDIVLDPEVPVILPIGPLANAVDVEIHATWMEGTLNANNGQPFPMTPDTLVLTDHSLIAGVHGVTAWINRAVGFSRCSTPSGWRW